MWEALSNVSSDYISAGIFAGSLLVNLVYSIMEFNKIPDFFALFSLLIKNINFSPNLKLDEGGFVNFMNKDDSSDNELSRDQVAEKCDKLASSRKNSGENPENSKNY